MYRKRLKALSSCGRQSSSLPRWRRSIGLRTKGHRLIRRIRYLISTFRRCSILPSAPGFTPDVRARHSFIFFTKNGAAPEFRIISAHLQYPSLMTSCSVTGSKRLPPYGDRPRTALDRGPRAGIDFFSIARRRTLINPASPNSMKACRTCTSLTIASSLFKMTIDAPKFEM